MYCISIFIIAVNIKAEYSQISVVRFMTKEGWCKKYTTEVMFMSGSELNRARGSFKYSGLSIYAVIIGYQRHPSVINIPSNFSYSCFYEVHKGCITDVTKPYTGKDQYGITWEICVNYNC
jgi:hypothetical protein